MKGKRCWTKSWSLWPKTRNWCLVTVTALEDEGFEVIETEHAEAALGVLQNHAARVNVLFTDIQMPGTMDGLALAHHTAKNWPKIALLLTSALPARVSRISPKNASFW